MAQENDLQRDTNILVTESAAVLRGGNEGAVAGDFDEIYRTQGAYVVRLLRRLGVPAGDVEDVAQEVFVAVLAGLPRFEGRASPRTWVYSIAVRIASAHRRKSARRGEILVERPDDVADERADSFGRRAAQLTIDRVLEELDDQKRTVFVLFEIDGLAMAEISEIVGCPLKTAYTRLYAAQKQVQAVVHRMRARESF